MGDDEPRPLYRGEKTLKVVERALELLGDGELSCGENWYWSASGKLTYLGGNADQALAALDQIESELKASDGEGRRVVAEMSLDDLADAVALYYERLRERHLPLELVEELVKMFQASIMFNLAAPDSAAEVAVDLVGRSDDRADTE